MSNLVKQFTNNLDPPPMVETLVNPQEQARKLGDYLEGAIYRALSAAPLPARAAAAQAELRHSYPQLFAALDASAAAFAQYFEQALTGPARDLDSSAVGDILLPLKNKKAVLEVKFQSDAKRDIKWFTLTDTTLFGNKWRRFLYENRDTYWTYKRTAKNWKDTSIGDALFNFITTNNLNYRYFLSKSRVNADPAHKKIAYLHRNAENHHQLIINAASLADLDRGQVKMRREQSAMQFYIENAASFTRNRYSSKGNFYAASHSIDAGRVASLQIASFSNPHAVGPLGASWSFQMYLARKLFD